MAVSQTEYNAFKTEVAANISKLETVVLKSNADAAGAQAELVDHQQSYGQISLQAAPWSAAISAEVAASESKATSALADVSALYEATKTEVEDLRRRASEVEKRSTGDKKGKWDEVACNSAKNYACQIAPDTTPAGIIGN